MLYLYVPFNDAELVTAAGNYTEEGEVNPRPDIGGLKVRVHGTPTASLQDLWFKDTLHILAHGRESTGSQIAGMVEGYLWGKRMVTMTAIELANALLADKLTRTFRDIRLMVCWGGYVGGSIPWGEGGGTLKRKATEAPFAGQLCSALKGLGFENIIVTGYRGSVLYNKGNQPIKNTLVSGSDGNLLANPEPLSGGLKLATQGKVKIEDKAKGLVESRKVVSLDSSSRTVWY